MKPPRKPNARPEQAFQIAVNKFLRYALPVSAVYYHVPNGGYRTPTEALRFKAMGVVPGVPDFMIHCDGRTFGIELKATKGSVSENQSVMMVRLQEAGVPCAVCRTLDEVATFLTGEGVALRASPFARLDLAP